MAVGLLAALISGTAVAIAQDDSPKARAETETRARPLARELLRELGPLAPASSCGTTLDRPTLRCLKRQIVRTQDALLGLVACMGLYDIARYGENEAGGTFGYVWRDSQGELLTTGLDFLNAGDTLPPDYVALGWLC